MYFCLSYNVCFYHLWLKTVWIVSLWYVIGPLQDPVTWYGINYAGTQMTQRDFQNKEKPGWTGTSSLVLEVPLRYCVPAWFNPYHVTGSCKGPIEKCCRFLKIYFAPWNNFSIRKRNMEQVQSHTQSPFSHPVFFTVRFKIKLQLCSCYEHKIPLVVLLGNQLGVKQRKG